MTKMIKAIFYAGPLIFAFGFLWPLSAQIIGAAGWTPPFGLSAMQTGFLVALLLGAPAQLRGRWL